MKHRKKAYKQNGLAIKDRIVSHIIESGPSSDKDISNSLQQDHKSVAALVTLGISSGLFRHYDITVDPITGRHVRRVALNPDRDLSEGLRS